LKIYLQFVQFLFPLVLTTIVQELGGQFLSGGMARMPQATETLASYGLAWGLVTFLTSPMLQARQLGIVLVDGPRAYRQVALFVLLCGALLTMLVAVLALTPLGAWVVGDLHGEIGEIGIVARQAMAWLIPFPLLRGLQRFYDGLLVRIRRTDVVSYATLAGIGVNVVSVFVLLNAGFVRTRPIRLPLLVTYAGAAAELAVVIGGYRRLARRALTSTSTGRCSSLSMGSVLRFFWPLALIMAVQGVSRPVINLFISREPDGAASLAVLTVVYSLGRLPYGWLNDLRSLPTPFQRWRGSLPRIRRFALACGLLSFASMVVMFWTPLREVIVGRLIGLEAGLAVRARVPLVIYAFFSFAVMTRAYFHGVGLLERRTEAMAPSAPARLGTIVIALLVLPALGIRGATRGVAALLVGFAVEAAAVLWGVRGTQIVARVSAWHAQRTAQKQ